MRCDCGRKHCAGDGPACTRAAVDAANPDPPVASAVDHPAHYNTAGARYETIKVIDSWRLGFSLGNALKYLLRAPFKGAHDQDMAKARWYLQHAVDVMERPPARMVSMSVREVFDAYKLPDNLYEVLYSIKIGDPSTALQALMEAEGLTP